MTKRNGMRKRYYPKRHNKKTIQAIVKKEINKKAEKKFRDMSYITDDLTPYSTLSTNWSDYSMINVAQGIGQSQRIGDSIFALKFNVRLTFELAPNTQSTVDPPAFVQFLIVRYPHKASDIEKLDMAKVLQEQNSNGTSDSFGQLYNSPYERDSSVPYKILTRKRFTMVDRTASQLKTFSLSYQLHKKMQFGQATDDVSPVVNPIGLYIIGNRNVRVSVCSSLVYTDI